MLCERAQRAWHSNPACSPPDRTALPAHRAVDSRDHSRLSLRRAARPPRRLRGVGRLAGGRTMTSVLRSPRNGRQRSATEIGETDGHSAAGASFAGRRPEQECGGGGRAGYLLVARGCSLARRSLGSVDLASSSSQPRRSSRSRTSTRRSPLGRDSDRGALTGRSCSALMGRSLLHQQFVSRSSRHEPPPGPHSPSS